MSDEAFLRAVLEDPDNDSTRLVYADWLEERGDMRGEFIRVQCALRRLARDDPGRLPLRQREQALLTDENWSLWGGAFRPYAYSWEFRGGLVEKLWISATRLREHAATLFQMAPVRCVRLYSIGEGALFWESPWLERMVGLDLEDHNGSGFLSAVIAGRLPRLRELRFWGRWLD